MKSCLYYYTTVTQQVHHILQLSILHIILRLQPSELLNSKLNAFRKKIRIWNLTEDWERTIALQFGGFGQTELKWICYQLAKNGLQVPKLCYFPKINMAENHSSKTGLGIHGNMHTAIWSKKRKTPLTCLQSLICLKAYSMTRRRYINHLIKTINTLLKRL